MNPYYVPGTVMRETDLVSVPTGLRVRGWEQIMSQNTKQTK